MVSMTPLRQLRRFGLLLLAISLAHAERPSKLALELQRVSPGASVDVIVQFRAHHTEVHHQKLRKLGGRLKGELHFIEADSYSIPAGALASLAQDPEVAYISPDHTVKGSLDYSAPAVNAQVAWQYGLDGSGIGIAVIDSGISQAADLMSLQSWQGRIVYNESFVPDASQYDDYGHGTHVAGTVAGNGRSSTGEESVKPVFRGVAPNAQLINLKVLDGNGQGQDSAVIAAIQRAIQLKSMFNIRVINLSLGRPVFESYTIDPLCQAVEAAWHAGIVVVVAAGNGGRDNSHGTDGYATISAPGNDPYVITVGAMKTMGSFSRSDHRIASYSSKGPTLFDHVVKPDLVAPGNRVASIAAKWSTLYNLYPANCVPLPYYSVETQYQDSANSYFRLSGTSMAAPIVSGAAVLLLQKQPGLTPDQVKARLMKTAGKTFPSSSISVDPVTGQTYISRYDLFTVGAGYLDIGAALASSEVAAGSALSPRVAVDPITGAVTLVTDTSVVWGTSPPWGTSVVWGTNVLSGTSVVWGSSVVWGTTANLGFSVVWGGSVVWGTLGPASSNDSIQISGEN